MMSESTGDDPQRLPGILDIAPSGGRCPDEKGAARHFHGLDLEQATALLRENPLHYLEDFYYLGPRAFAFYDPAVRTLVREGRLGEPDGGEWERLISVVELRIADGLLPPESVPVLRECLDALAEQMPAEADWPAQFDEYAIYAEVASKLERVRAKLAEQP